MNEILFYAATFCVGGLFGAVAATARRRRRVLALLRRVEASEQARNSFAVRVFQLERALGNAEAKIRATLAANETEAPVQ